MTNSLFTRRQVLQLTGGAAAVGLAGCTGNQSGDDSGSEPTTSAESGHSEEEGGHSEGVGEPTDTAEVTMITEGEDYHFEPHVVRVTVGGTVTWTNENGSHSTTAYHPDNDQPQLVPDGAASWNSGILSEQGMTFEHTFETEGVYHYYCTPHESLGMIGSIIVGDPNPDEQVALEEPPADKSDQVREKLKELNTTISEALGDSH
ncbi:MAG: plastocyanin [Natronomonas sp.]|jgi:plastocyanin|uniref:plastocyanin/azurin family copper-binding protein n=1 Tax=Natronomonas sp. TaxID=2184060 RepID=UPI003988AE6E